jgi:MFS family permease
VAAADNDDFEFLGKTHAGAAFYATGVRLDRAHVCFTWNIGRVAAQQMLRPYAVLLRAPDVLYLLAASIIGRLPIGMCGLAILLLVQGAHGSFAMAGATTAAYVAGLAASAPVLGRIIDRRGPRLLLALCALAFPASLVALVAAVHDDYAGAWLFGLAVAAGATFPPITVCMRTYLRQRFAEEPSLATAFSLDSVLIEVMFIAGPMLVALLVALNSAALAVACAAAFSLVGVALFLRSPALRAWRVAPRTRSSFLGPLAQPDFVVLVLIFGCYAIAFGLAELGVTAYAAQAQHPALAGIFLGVMSVGSAFGGLAYGSRTWRGPLARQFALMLAIMGAGLAPLAGSWSLVTFGIFSTLGGVVMAPALIIQSMLVAKTALAEHATEAFTWSTSALLAGVGLGMALGGTLVERWGASAPFIAAAAAAWLAAAAAFLFSRR